MNWIIVALIVFVSSTLLYLTLRKVRPFNLSDEIQNLSFFLLPAVSLFIYNISRHSTFRINLTEALSTFLVAVFLWIGNTFLLKSLKTAPNPGYTVLIAKSYLIITTLLSPLLFDSVITFKSVFAIGLILFFLSLILIEKKKVGPPNRTHWLRYACITFAMWGVQALILISIKNSLLNSSEILMLVSIFYSLIVVGEILIKKVSLAPVIKYWPWIILISIAAMFSNLFVIVGYKLAPNPGFIDSANAASVAAIAILACIFFKDNLSVKKGLGIIGVSIGLILLLV